MDGTLFFNCGFNLHHDIWWYRIHFMSSFCVFGNFDHQFSFGGSRSLKPTVLGKTFKRWHLLHQSVIIPGSIYFYPARQILLHVPLFHVGDDTKHILAHQVNNTLGKKKIIFSGSLDEHHGSGKSNYHTSWQRNGELRRGINLVLKYL